MHSQLPIKKCPKCGHIRSPEDTNAPECCPSCGLYFEKWVMRNTPARVRKQHPEEEEAASPEWLAALRERLLHIPQPLDMTWLYGRALLLALFLFWGIRLAKLDYRDGEMGGSFMHAILLPIHEAGHVLFIPFGEFLTILGGSLFQLVLPLIVAAALLWQNRDPIGATLGIWWCGVSLMDLAPYIYDAKHPQLTLLGGHTGEDGPHDWIYLLGMAGKIEQAQWYGFITHKLGVVVMLGAIAGGAALLWRIWRARGLMQ
jgi:hypothetical protein